MKMFIHSSFGVLDCAPMQMQDIEKNSVSELQAKEDLNSSVTADDQEEPRSASDSC